MIGGLKLWWLERSVRERRMLGVMAAILVPVLLWLCIWMPVEGTLQSAKEDHKAAVLRNGDVRAMVRALSASKQVRPAIIADISQTVSLSGNESGFTIGQIAAQSDGRVGFNIASARAPALFAWLSSLEQKGVMVDTVTLSPTVGVGTVSAQISLSSARR